MGKFCQIFTELSAPDMIMAGYYSLTFLLAKVFKRLCLLNLWMEVDHTCPDVRYWSGPSCSKLTTSLVNNSLKFTSSDTQIC